MKILNRLSVLLLCLAYLFILNAQVAAQDKQLYNVDTIIDLYFDRISAQAKQHDWNSFRSLFLPTTQINAIGINKKGENEFYPQDLEEYIQHLKDYT